MAAVRVSDRSSVSRSRRVTPYVVTTFSYAAAIAGTLVQLSAISVPEWSALNPPKEGMTSPPAARILAMSVPCVDQATGAVPFQVMVHEPREGVCRKAIVRYFAPDW